MKWFQIVAIVACVAAASVSAEEFCYGEAKEGCKGLNGTFFFVFNQNISSSACVHERAACVSVCVAKAK